MPSVSVTSTMATRTGRNRVERLVADELHLGALAQHRRVLHARLVVRRLERRGLVEQHHGDHVLQADVRHVAIVDDGGDCRRQPHDDAASPDRRRTGALRAAGSSASSGAWIGEPTVHFLMLVRAIS